MTAILEWYLFWFVQQTTTIFPFFLYHTLQKADKQNMILIQRQEITILCFKLPFFFLFIYKNCKKLQDFEILNNFTTNKIPLEEIQKT